MRWEDQVPERAFHTMIFDEDNLRCSRLPIALVHGFDHGQVISKMGGLLGMCDPLEFCGSELVHSTAEHTVWERLSDEDSRRAFIDVMAQSREGTISAYMTHALESMWRSTFGRDAFATCDRGEFVDPMFLVRTRLPLERGSELIGDMDVQILAGEGFKDLADVMDSPILWTGKSGFHVDNTASWALNNPHAFGFVLDGFFVNNGFLWRPSVWELVAWEDGVWWVAWADMLM